MLTRQAILIILLAISSYCYSQDAETIVSNFKTLASNVPSMLGNEDDCSNILRQNENILEQIDQAIENGGLSQDDRNLLSWGKSHSNALDKFIRTVGESGYVANYLKESELSLVKELFEVDFVEVFKEKNFCCKLYECNLNGYTCLLAFKPGNKDIYTIKATIQYRNGSSKTEMGLTTNQYRRIWSSSTVKFYKVISISCQYKGQSFDF